jgi:hypothetical protein
MSELKTVGLGLIAAGGVSAIVALLLYLRSRRFLEGAVRVQGLVTGLVESTGGESGSVYRPVIEFTTIDGQSVTYTDMVGNNPPKYTPGATVDVMYPPGNPQAARIPSWFRLWFLTSFAALFAVLFLAIGVPVFLSAGEAEPEVTLPPGISIPSGLPTELPTGVLPTDILPPEVGQLGSVLVVQRGSGIPQTYSPTCESVRDVRGGKAREVRLDLDGDTLIFTASPYTGPGPYTPEMNLRVGGDVFAGSEALTGAVVFDSSGQGGAINLVAGPTFASGTWDCTGVKVSSG